MKRIFTLVLTVCLALSAMALSNVSYEVVKASTVQPALSSAVLEKPHTMKQGLTPARLEYLAQRAGVAEAAETIQINGSISDCYYELGEWYVAVKSADGAYAVQFGIESENAESFVGEYDEKVASSGLCGVYDYVNVGEDGKPATSDFTTFTLKITEANGVMALDATAVAENGNTYVIHATETDGEVIEPGETIQINGSISECFYEFGEWYVLVMGADGLYAAEFGIESEDSESFVGEYDEEAASYGLCNVHDLKTLDEEGDPTAYEMTTFTLKVTEAGGVMTLDATAVAEDGNTYVIHATDGEVDVQKIVNVKAHNMRIENYEGMWYEVYASNEDYNIQIDLEPDQLTTPYGTWSADSINFYLTPGATAETVAEAQIVVSQDETGDKLTGTVLLYDGTQYVLEFDATETKVLPELPAEVDFTAGNFYINTSLASWMGVYICEASNELYTGRIYLQTGLVYGQHTEVMIFSLTDTETGAAYELEVASADITVGRNASGDALVGTIQTTNNKTITLTWTQTFPEKPETAIDLVFETENTKIVIVSGAFQFGSAGLFPEANLPEGYDGISMSLAFFADGVAGTYSNVDVYGTATGMYYTNSANQNDFVEAQISLSNVTVEDDTEAETYTLTGDVLTLDGVLYHVTMVAPYPKVEPLEYDASEGAVDRAFTTEDFMEMKTTDYSELYGFYAVAFDVESTEDLFGLMFFTDQLDSKFTLPEGTYTINSTQAPGTVYASAGISDGQPTYSLYATFSGDNLEKLYFLVSGTVTVAHTDGELRVTVDALNSYGLSVHLTYNALQTGLTDTEAEAVTAKKVITPEGQLQIIRGEHIYDATGAVIR